MNRFKVIKKEFIKIIMVATIVSVVGGVYFLLNNRENELFPEKATSYNNVYDLATLENNVKNKEWLEGLLEVDKENIVIQQVKSKNSNMKELEVDQKVTLKDTEKYKMATLLVAFSGDKRTVLRVNGDDYLTVADIEKDSKVVNNHIQIDTREIPKKVEFKTYNFLVTE